jgi:hypothetical protein
MFKRSHIVSFLDALGSLFDVFPMQHEPAKKKSTFEFLNRNDADAIRADWEAVGRDMWKAIGEFEAAHGIQRPKVVYEAGRSKSSNRKS